MSNLVSGFDANTVKPNEFEPIPAGDYIAAITESESKPTVKGDGEYLNLKFVILEGEKKNRVLYDRLVLKHPNPQTVQIARGQLSAICRAVGVMVLKDSVELHNLPLKVRVALRKREDTGEMTNEIKGYKPKNEKPNIDAVAGAKKDEIGKADSTEKKPAPWKKKSG
jgi:hypothetical protein